MSGLLRRIRAGPQRRLQEKTKAQIDRTSEEEHRYDRAAGENSPERLAPMLMLSDGRASRWSRKEHDSIEGAPDVPETPQTLVGTKSTPKPAGSPTFFAEKGLLFESDEEGGEYWDGQPQGSDAISLNSAAFNVDLDDDMSTGAAFRLPETCGCDEGCQRVLRRAMAERELVVSQSALVASQLRMMTARRDHYARRYYRATDMCERLKAERDSIAQELEMVQRQQNVLMEALKLMNSRTPCRDEESVAPSSTESPFLSPDSSAYATMTSTSSVPAPVALPVVNAPDEGVTSDCSTVLGRPKPPLRNASLGSSFSHSEGGETGYASCSDLRGGMSPDAGPIPGRVSHHRRRSSATSSAGAASLSNLLEMCRRFENDLHGALSDLQSSSTDPSSFAQRLSRGISQASLASQRSNDKGDALLSEEDALRLGSIITALNNLSNFGSTLSLHSTLGECRDRETTAYVPGERATLPRSTHGSTSSATATARSSTWTSEMRTHNLSEPPQMSHDAQAESCEASSENSSVRTYTRVELPRSRLSDFVSHVNGRAHDDDSLVDQEIKHIFGKPGWTQSPSSSLARTAVPSDKDAFSSKLTPTGSEKKAGTNLRDQKMQSVSNDRGTSASSKGGTMSGLVNDARRALKRLSSVSQSPSLLLAGEMWNLLDL